MSIRLYKSSAVGRCQRLAGYPVLIDIVSSIHMASYILYLITWALFKTFHGLFDKHFLIQNT